MSEVVIVALISFLSGLALAIPSALEKRANAKLNAKKTDLDELRGIIDTMRGEIKRIREDHSQERAEWETERCEYEERLKTLEDARVSKDREIGRLEEKVRGMERDKGALEIQVKSLVGYIDLLTEVMKAHNIPVPERKR